jgi:PKD repeat protein
LKGVYNVVLELQLPKNVTYVSNTGGGKYNTTAHRVVWQIDLPPKSSGSLSVKCKVKWGLPQNSYIHFYLYANITKLTLIKHYKSLVTTARDPNVKQGPEGNVEPGEKLNYKVEYENEGKGIAFGVYVTDTLDEHLDDSTLTIGVVKSTKDNSQIAPAGIYDSATRTITWFVGEVGPGLGGYADISVNVRSDAPYQTAIINFATVYFPSVPEVTPTNSIISIVNIKQKPVADAGINKVVETLEDVKFDASRSSDSDGTIISYDWDFGDGNVGSGKTVTHNYQDDGIYTVILTVEDNDGLKDTHEIKVYVNNRLPEAALIGNPEKVKTLEDVTFDSAGSIDEDGKITEYYFDFGDGSNSGWIQTQTVIHQYVEGEKYYVASLKVKDDDGAVSTNIAKSKIIVLNREPVAELTVNPQEAFTYEDVVCSAAASIDYDGIISEYYFDFGDGTNSGWVTTSSVKHQYTDGTMNYDITLKVKDNHGVLSADDSIVKVLINNRKPTAAVTASQPDVLTYEDISFDASGSSDLDGDLEYFFDFGDGSNSGWLTTEKTTHQYKDGPKEYNVELTVRDDDEETDTSEIIITVKNRLPIAEAGPDHTAEAAQEVSFIGIESYDTDGEISSYQWDFGDGSSDTGSSVTHEYDSAGTYEVTLTVIDDDGDEGIDNCIVTISKNRPKASFDVNLESGSVNTIFEFQSTSYDIDGTIVELFWDFGDDTTSTETNPTHQYETDGMYTATLIVQDNDGLDSTEFQKIITVLNSDPVAKFTATPQHALIGEDISFDASESFDIDGDALSYTWDFGHGNTAEGKLVQYSYNEIGTYTVKLTVSDDKGKEAETSFDIKIDEKRTEEDQSQKEQFDNLMTFIAIIAVILVLIVLFAISLRKKKEPAEESEAEEEEQEQE